MAAHPSSSATKRMNQQAPGVVRPSPKRYAQREHPGFRTLFPNEPTHNMPLRQHSGRGLTLETGLARELGSLPSAALRSAPPMADSIRTGWPLLPRRHRPQMLRVFGRLPFTDVMRFSEAGVRKASREETAGGVCAGSGVGLWGFSAGVCPDLSVSNRDEG